MLSSAQRKQRQLAPVQHGIYVRAPAGRQLRDRSVTRLTQKLRAVLPLTPADIPTARAWCEIEVLARLAFHELRTHGLTTGQGEPRRLLGAYRQMRQTQLAYGRDLGMTPQARKSLGADPGREGDPVERLRNYISAADARKPRPAAG